MPRTPGAPRPRRLATQKARRRHPEWPRGLAVQPNKDPSPQDWPPMAPLWAPLGTGSPHPMAPAHQGDLAAPGDPAVMPMRDS